MEGSGARKCRLCDVRRPRRFCPGVGGDICSICCGTEREVTVHCPFDCEYLADAREHDRLPEVHPSAFPNQDIRVTESFLREHEPLLIFTAQFLFRHATAAPGIADGDVREALDSLIRTYRTMQSGLIYETRPPNPLAAAIHERMQASLQEFRQNVTERAGMALVRDVDVLGVLAFLQRLEIQHNNGRRAGRAFLHFLRSYFAAPGMGAAADPASSLLRP